MIDETIASVDFAILSQTIASVDEWEAYKIGI